MSSYAGESYWIPMEETPRFEDPAKQKTWVALHPAVREGKESLVLRYVDGMQLAEILDELRQRTRNYLQLEVVPLADWTPRERPDGFREGRVVVILNRVVH